MVIVVYYSFTWQSSALFLFMCWYSFLFRFYSSFLAKIDYKTGVVVAVEISEIDNISIVIGKKNCRPADLVFIVFTFCHNNHIFHLYVQLLHCQYKTKLSWNSFFNKTLDRQTVAKILTNVLIFVCFFFHSSSWMRTKRNEIQIFGDTLMRLFNFMVSVFFRLLFCTSFCTYLHSISDSNIADIA